MGDFPEDNHFLDQWSAADQERARINRELRYQDTPADPRSYLPPQCPGCGLVMSRREAAEQGRCNDCHPGGACEL